MSTLSKFNTFWFSDWFLTILQRALFPCKTEAEIKQWEDKVAYQFLEDGSAVC